MGISGADFVGSANSCEFFLMGDDLKRETRKRNGCIVLDGKAILFKGFNNGLVIV
jgi:hypothetical protein